VESVAECVSGVTDIANQLRIRPSEHPKAEPASETEPREPSERPKVESDPEHRVER